MRNSLIVAAASFGLLLGTIPTFAADNPKTATEQQAQHETGNLDSQCANILANPSGHPASDVDYCKSKQKK